MTAGPDDGARYLPDGVRRYPVDRVARRVSRPSPKWVALDPVEDGGQDSFRRPPTGPFVRYHPDHVDWTGRRVGLLRVVGPGRRDPSKSLGKRFRWIVQCQCGRYSRRKPKTLARHFRRVEAGESPFDSCQTCRSRLQPSEP